MNICIWPDASWIYEDEYDHNAYAYKGDDFLTIAVPTNILDDEDAIDEWAYYAVNPNL